MLSDENNKIHLMQLLHKTHCSKSKNLFINFTPTPPQHHRIVSTQYEPGSLNFITFLTTQFIYKRTRFVNIYIAKKLNRCAKYKTQKRNSSRLNFPPINNNVLGISCFVMFAAPDSPSPCLKCGK